MSGAQRPDALAHRLAQLAEADDATSTALLRAVEDLRGELVAVRADREQAARDREAAQDLARVVRGAVESLQAALHALRADVVDAAHRPPATGPAVTAELLAGVSARVQHLEAWVSSLDEALDRPADEPVPTRAPVTARPPVLRRSAAGAAVVPGPGRAGPARGTAAPVRARLGAMPTAPSVDVALDAASGAAPRWRPEPPAAPPQERGAPTA